MHGFSRQDALRRVACGSAAALGAECGVRGAAAAATQSCQLPATLALLCDVATGQEVMVLRL